MSVNPYFSPSSISHPMDPCIHIRDRTSPRPTSTTSETLLRLNHRIMITAIAIRPRRNELESNSRLISTFGLSPSRIVTVTLSVLRKLSSIDRYIHSIEHGSSPFSAPSLHSWNECSIGLVLNSTPSRVYPNSDFASSQEKVQPSCSIALLSILSIIQAELADHLPGPQFFDVIVPSSSNSPSIGPITLLDESGRNALSEDRNLRKAPWL